MIEAIKTERITIDFMDGTYTAFTAINAEIKDDMVMIKDMDGVLHLFPLRNIKEVKARRENGKDKVHHSR